MHLLVGAGVILLSEADLDFGPVQVGVGVHDESPDVDAEVEHHVLRTWLGRVVKIGHRSSKPLPGRRRVGRPGSGGQADGVSYPSWGVPRYGNVGW